MSRATRKLVWVQPHELHPYQRNPRINDRTVDKVVESIERFGFNSPIVADENLEILAGHTRWKAALKLGLEKIPVFVVSGLTPKQKQAFRIADNRLVEFSEWDWEQLIDELKEIDDESIDELFEFDLDVPEDFELEEFTPTGMLRFTIEFDSREEFDEFLERYGFDKYTVNWKEFRSAVSQIAAED